MTLPARHDLVAERAYALPASVHGNVPTGQAATWIRRG
jgi:hypothetical protein